MPNVHILQITKHTFHYILPQNKISREDESTTIYNTLANILCLFKNSVLALLRAEFGDLNNLCHK